MLSCYSNRSNIAHLSAGRQPENFDGRHNYPEIPQAWNGV
jgi:hypothetical protein